MVFLSASRLIAGAGGLLCFYNASFDLASAEEEDLDEALLYQSLLLL